jgi:peroxiredoxin
MSLPVVNHVAPDFSLPSTAGGTVTLSGLRGSNVLLAFFPLAFTGVCTTEFCDFSHDLPRFDASGTIILGISVDSVPTLTEFRARRGITVDLLSDFRREVSRRYGTLLEDAFFSRRAYFIIDRAGVLRWSWVEAEIGHKRDNRELLDQLALLR